MTKSFRCSDEGDAACGWDTAEALRRWSWRGSPNFSWNLLSPTGDDGCDLLDYRHQGRELMGHSSPSIHLSRELHVDAVLHGEIPPTEDFSDISGVFNPSPELPLASWTLAHSDDDRAPEVTCEILMFDEELARLQARSSRSIGHGLRPVFVTEKVQVPSEPSVVVTIYL